MTPRQFTETILKILELNPQYEDSELYVLNGGPVEGYGIGGGRPGIAITHGYRPEHSERSKWETFEAVFTLAGIKILGHWELTNQYYPRSYVDAVLSNPWWLVMTEMGLIEIGWRKRVININWQHTPVRRVITEDNVTKDSSMVHAYSIEKALEYLKSWQVEVQLMKEVKT